MKTRLCLKAILIMAILSISSSLRAWDNRFMFLYDIEREPDTTTIGDVTKTGNYIHLESMFAERETKTSLSDYKVGKLPDGTITYSSYGDDRSICFCGRHHFPKTPLFEQTFYAKGNQIIIKLKKIWTVPADTDENGHRKNPADPFGCEPGTHIVPFKFCTNNDCLRLNFDTCFNVKITCSHTSRTLPSASAYTYRNNPASRSATYDSYPCQYFTHTATYTIDLEEMASALNLSVKQLIYFWILNDFYIEVRDMPKPTTIFDTPKSPYQLPVGSQDCLAYAAMQSCGITKDDIIKNYPCSMYASLSAYIDGQCQKRDEMREFTHKEYAGYPNSFPNDMNNYLMQYYNIFTAYNLSPVSNLAFKRAQSEASNLGIDCYNIIRGFYSACDNNQISAQTFVGLLSNIIESYTTITKNIKPTQRIAQAIAKEATLHAIHAGNPELTEILISGSEFSQTDKFEDMRKEALGLLHISRKEIPDKEPYKTAWLRNLQKNSLFKDCQNYQEAYEIYLGTIKSTFQEGCFIAPFLPEESE